MVAFKPKTWKNLSEDDVRALINTHIGTAFSTGDPINTQIVKRNIYMRQKSANPDVTSMSFEQAYAFGAYLSDLGRQRLLRIALTGHPLDTKGFAEKLEGTANMYRSRCVATAVGLQTKGITAIEIAGISAGVFDWDIPTYINPKAAEVFDNCGMGGDLMFTPNLSNAALLVAAGEDTRIHTCKHGSPGNTDRAGSSEFAAYLLKKFGGEGLVSRVSAGLAPEQHAEVIDTAYYAHTEACDKTFKTIHLQTHLLSGLAHINDILGPITAPINPAKVKRKIIGVNHLLPPETVAKAYQVLNSAGVTNLGHALFIRGEDPFVGEDKTKLDLLSMDEFTTFGPTTVATLDGDTIKVGSITPEEAGLERFVPTEEIKVDPTYGRILVKGISPELGGDAKPEMTLELLRNSGPQRALDLLVMNVAPIFVLHNTVKDLKDGAELARQRVAENKGYARAQLYVQAIEETLKAR